MFILWVNHQLKTKLKGKKTELIILNVFFNLLIELLLIKQLLQSCDVRQLFHKQLWVPTCTHSSLICDQLVISGVGYCSVWMSQNIDTLIYRGNG